ncbi:MAG TPA: putative quinol monooxygenase [Burkholderiaceae bacterium]|nr:putative quinol monooxygenase [Burkholderiaceae bacterium]
MVIVLGSIVARPDTFAEVLKLSQEHVTRSRREPGCVSHAVHQDTEETRRLVFVEEWADRAALAEHFKVAESRAFVKALSALVSEPPRITVYDATLVQV